MKTKLDYYRIFYESARCASFSKAAAQLYISQSAVSQSIRQLEHDLNTKLFMRSRHGVALTLEGELIYRSVESGMKAIEQAEDLLEQRRHLESGSLFIAAGDTITSQFLLPYLERFHQRYPNIRIELSNSYSARMIEMVRERKADLAFVHQPVQQEDICFEPLAAIQDIFVAAPPLVKAGTYSREAIAALPLILLESNSTSRQYVDQQFAQSGIVLQPQIEIAAHELLLQFAAIQLGVACVVKEFSTHALQSGKVVELALSEPLAPRYIGCAYLKRLPLTQAARSFLQLIQADRPSQKQTMREEQKKKPHTVLQRHTDKRANAPKHKKKQGTM